MKFSESVVRRLPKRTISPDEYQILARSRYSSRYGVVRIDRINDQEMAHTPDVLKKLGFVVIRNMLTRSATRRAEGVSLRDKYAVNALHEAWGRVALETMTEEPQISVITNKPGSGVRFDKPGLHMVIPGGNKEAACVTRHWRQAITALHPGDALVWEQGDTYLPSVELQNPYHKYASAFVLHESVTYANPLLAPEVPPVSQ